MSNELGNTPADKNYKPSGISKAEERAFEMYPEDWIWGFGGRESFQYDRNAFSREACRRGYEQAEKDISALIESIIEGIIGDAQPKPILRAELQELITKIKEEKQ